MLERYQILSSRDFDQSLDKHLNYKHCLSCFSTKPLRYPLHKIITCVTFLSALDVVIIKFRTVMKGDGFLRKPSELS